VQLLVHVLKHNVAKNPIAELLQFPEDRLWQSKEMPMKQKREKLKLLLFTQCD
jgi:hypothetical protein